MPQSALSPILEVKEVYKEFSHDLFTPKRSALSGLSFSLLPGSITAIFGHNGAGKTTCFRLILGMLSLDSGLILYKSRPMQQQDRRYVGYMPESKKMSQDLTPREILKLQAALYQIPLTTEKLEEQLHKVGLSENSNRQISSLSKGMGRRLAWALATIHQPELLILDEPFSGLDPLAQQQMSAWIREWTQKGGAVLMSAHEMFLVQNLATDLLVFKNGKIALTDKMSAFSSENFLSYFIENISS